MGLRITTESGAVYWMEPGRIMRESRDPRRGDGDWLPVWTHSTPTVGESMQFMLEPLAEWADWTQRVTSPVVSIEEYGPDEEDGT